MQFDRLRALGSEWRDLNGLADLDVAHGVEKLEGHPLNWSSVRSGISRHAGERVSAGIGLEAADHDLHGEAGFGQVPVFLSRVAAPPEIPRSGEEPEGRTVQGIDRREALRDR